MNYVYLLLGANVGNRKKNIDDAIVLIANSIGKLMKQSHIYETAAWGNTEQQSFYNLVMLVETEYNAFETLERILDIEQQLGRTRNVKWEARIIDIDILFFNDEIIDDDELKVPHPFLHQRRFALEPLNEIAPDFKHPTLYRNVAQLIIDCEDKLDVKKLEF